MDRRILDLPIMRMMNNRTILRVIRMLPVPGALAILCGVASAQPPGPPKDWKIESNRLGPIRLGMPKSEVIRLASKYGLQAQNRTVRMEGDEYPVVVLTRGRDSLARLEFIKNAVWRITVINRFFQTAKGIRVGSRFSEMARRYGKGHIGFGEGEVCAIYPERSPGLSFCLADARKFAVQAPDVPWESVLRVNPRILSILITGKN